MIRVFTEGVIDTSPALWLILTVILFVGTAQSGLDSAPMDPSSFKHSFSPLVDMLQRPLYYTDPWSVYENSNWKIMDVTCSAGHTLAVHVLLTLLGATSCHSEL